MMLETIVFQVTTKCSLNCPQCYMQKGKENLAVQTAKKLINDFGAKAGIAVQFTGGEPMMYHKLSTLINCANHNKLFSVVATSGMGHSLELYQGLKDSGLDILCISLNDIDEKKNAITREPFDVSLSAIRTAREVGLTCYVNVVITDQNIDNVELLAQYLFNIGVEIIVFLRPVKSFDGQYIPTVSINTIRKLKELIEKNPELFLVENCFKEYWEYTSKQIFICKDAGEKTIFVNADGTISPCSQLQQYRYNSIDEMMMEKHVWEGACCR